jgi:microsomal dipeptidase-like Zn-dependent dipeptidase
LNVDASFQESNALTNPELFPNGANDTAIGTDLDGGYGIEQTPNDLDTIADVQNIPDLLRNRGYGEEDIAAVMHGNWLRLVERKLPTT